MKKHFSTILLLFSVAFSVYAKPQSVQYVYPLNQSQYLPRNCEIILRQGSEIDASTLSADLFQISGKKSGTHSGQVKIATDNKTVIFTPDDLYDPNEKVTVNIAAGLQTIDGTAVPAFDFSFTTTKLEQPIDPTKYRKELASFRNKNSQSVHLSKSLADDVPDDFPEFTVTSTDKAAPGSFFFSPTHYIDSKGYNAIVENSGEVSYYKKIEDGVPFDFKVLPNGMLSYGVMFNEYAFAGGGDTDFYIMDSTFTVVDQYQMGNGYIADFHEFTYLANGHVFMVTYDLQPVNMEEIYGQGGHPGALVAGSVIQELDADQNVIFQWRSWDHYSLLDSYQDLDLTIFDAIHINAIDLDNDGNLLISTLALAEVTKINRQTGDIIWRMGGKNNQFTFFNESEENAPLYFMFQHDVRRIDNGHITMFDDGERILRNYSRVVEYEVDEEAMTATKVWEYRHSPDIYAPNMGSCQRMENGNTVIGWGTASANPMVKTAITEVTPNGEVVFELVFDKPLSSSYRALKFDWNGGAPAAYVMVSEVLQSNTYSFDQGDKITGITMRMNEIGGFGYNEVHIKRFNYGPIDPSFLDVAPIVEQKRIEISDLYVESIEAYLMFDVDVYEIERPEDIMVYYRQYVGRGLFVAIPTEYSEETNQVVATMTDFGEFVLGYPDADTPAFAPMQISPTDEQQVDQTHSVKLEWTPVGYITDYTLEIATDANFNNKVVSQEFLYDAYYVLENPASEQTYYWRVKAYNHQGESQWSPVRSFETTAPYIQLLAPVNSIQWKRGREYFIKWESNFEQDVVIDLYKNNTFVELVDTTANSSAYKWYVPLHLDNGMDYQIKISNVENASISDMTTAFAVKVEEENISTPSEFSLLQNYPNPFNPTTQIQYEIPKAAHVTLSIYDIRGVKVTTLVDEFQAANRYNVQFTAQNAATGVYFYTLQVGNEFTQTRKMLLVK